MGGLVGGTHQLLNCEMAQLLNCVRVVLAKANPCYYCPVPKGNHLFSIIIYHSSRMSIKQCVVLNFG